MSYWDSVGRWINTLLLFIVGIISFDTLFRLLEAQESNVIVGVTRLLAAIILVPFRGMFGDQEYVLTSLVAVLGYALLVGIALSVLRGLQATRVAPRVLDDRAPYPPRPGSTPQRAAASSPATRRADPQTGRTPVRKAPAGRSATAPNPRNRNGQAATSSRGNTPQPSDATGQRRSDGTAARGSGAAMSRGSAAAPGRADKATSSRPDVAATDTAATRKVEPAERDGSDD